MPGRGNPAPGHGFKGGVSPPRPSPTPAPSPFPAPGLRVRLAVWGAWSLPHGHTLPCRGALGSWERRLLSLVTASSHPVCVPGLCDVTHPPGWGGLAGGNRLSAPFLCFRPGRHLSPPSRELWESRRHSVPVPSLAPPPSAGEAVAGTPLPPTFWVGITIQSSYHHVASFPTSVGLTFLSVFLAFFFFLNDFLLLPSFLEIAHD